ncbi:MAG: hypothetical protein MUF48_24005 [Pirellulaceae bacterium]|jgi:hypothetical protein|nr:hypothetical protein [Pirellulaceae bacterium]
MIKLVCCWSGVVLACCLTGCEDTPAGSDASAQSAAKARSLTPPPPPPLESAAAAPPVAPAADDTSMSQNTTAPDAVPATDTTRVPAAVGVGIRGRKLDDPKLVQMIVTPARALFRTRERVVFEVQIPHALQLYEATNGTKPKSHDEFMQQIVQFNQIQLPELPPGQRYVYDPETGELMVEKPM